MPTLVKDLAEKRHALESATYDTRDLARLLKCSERHVRRLDAQRAIPGRICFGRCVRYSRRIVDSMLAGECGK